MDFQEFRRDILTIVDECYDGSMVDYIHDLLHNIKRLEAEREVLINRLREYEECQICKHSEKRMSEFPCNSCGREGKCFEWMGIPEKEGTDEQID